MIIKPNLFRFLFFNTALRMLSMLVLTILSFFIIYESKFFLDVFGFLLLFSFLVSLADNCYVLLFKWYSLTLNKESFSISIFNRGNFIEGQYYFKEKTFLEKANPFNKSITLVS
jgi:hypothetical protein